MEKCNTRELFKISVKTNWSVSSDHERTGSNP